MYYYIVNPTAGAGKFDKIQEEFLAALRVKKIEGEVAKTSGPLDAKKLAKMGAKKGARVIVAVGGDSTVEEVVNGIIEGGQAGVALGIIPTGKNNFFANSIGIKDWQLAIDNLVQGKIKRFDLAQAGDYYFLSSLDFGFPIKLAEKYAKQREKLNRWRQFKITRDLINNFPLINFRLKVASQYWASFKVVAGSFGNNFFFNNPNGFKDSPDSSDQKIHALFLHAFEQRSSIPKSLNLSQFRFGSIDQFSLIKERNFIFESEEEIHFKTAAFDFSAAKLRLKMHNKAIGIIVEGLPREQK